MPSSQNWRAGRWFWYCKEQNNASDWKDHWACGARSKFTYSTQEEAARAGAKHGYKTCHEIAVQCIQPRRRRKVRRKSGR